MTLRLTAVPLRTERGIIVWHDGYEQDARLRSPAELPLDTEDIEAALAEWAARQLEIVDEPTTAGNTIELSDEDLDALAEQGEGN